MMAMPQNGSGSTTSNYGVDPKYVRYVGDTVGVVNLSPAALQFLSEQVTKVLMKSLIRAKTFCAHGRRTRLTSDDLETALRMFKIKPPLGVPPKRGPQLQNLSMPNGEELFVNDDYDIDNNSSSLELNTKIPVSVHVKAHWLVIDGKSALVPENLRCAKADEDDETQEECDQSKAASILARRETAGGSHGASVMFRAASRVVETKEPILIRSTEPDRLSVEKQLYLKEIAEACVGHDDNRRVSALQSLEVDTGLQIILPRLSRLIYYAIRCNVIHRSLSILIYIVRMIRAITLNKSVKLEGVLHELIPSLLSCVVGKQLCNRPETDNHWALRDFASKTLASLVKEHGSADTRQRLLKTVLKVWETEESTYPMLYGCFSCFADFHEFVDRNYIMVRGHDLIAKTEMARHQSLSAVELVEAEKLNAHLRAKERKGFS